MFLFLIECLCKQGNEVWKVNSVVKAKDAQRAWNKFINQWDSEYKSGEVNIPLSVIIEFKVEKFCEAKEIIS